MDRVLGDAGYYYKLRGTRLGIGLADAATPQFALDVVGSVRCNDVVTTSDRRLKTDVSTVDAAECGAAVAAVGVYKYRLGGDDAGRARRLGVMAQEVRIALPGAVVEGEGGGLGVDVGQMVAALCGAVRDLQERVVFLEGRRSQGDVATEELGHKPIAGG